MQTYFVRRIDMNEETQFTAEIPTETFPVPDFAPSECVPVNAGAAGVTAAYVKADSEDEALKWARSHFP